MKQHHSFTSPLRYPGGKGGLANFVKMIISKNNLLDGDYVEVYAGGASIAWALLFEEYVSKVHINDLDESLIYFWQSVVFNTEALCCLIRDTPVNIEEWHRQKYVQENPQLHTSLEIGFSTFFLNRTNRSGILKGGVIGGKEQKGFWKIDARFNKQDLIKRIERIAKYASRIRIYNYDAEYFMKTILPTLPQKTFVYFDPPYFNKGQELYENHYEKNDHMRIASHIKQEIFHPWLVSYDAVPEILSLYNDQAKLEYNIQYSAHARYAGAEVIFYSQQLTLPEIQSPIKIKLPTLQRSLF